MASTTEGRIEDFAEELGKLLGTARNKAESWLGQRQQITKTLQGIRDEATNLLNQLGAQAQSALRRRGRPPGSGNRRGPRRPRKAAAGAAGQVRKRRTMSAEARARISAAQKARWAKQKAAAKKK